MNSLDAFRAVMIHIVVSALWHHTVWCVSTDVADTHIASVCNIICSSETLVPSTRLSATITHKITIWIIMPLNCENLTRVLRFSWRWFSRFSSYGLRHRAVFNVDTEVSVELAGSIFRVLQVWSWRQYISPKRCYLPRRQHWVKTQKISIPF